MTVSAPCREFEEGPAEASWLHRDPDLSWNLSSCYSDLWIELLHTMGLDPVPLLGSALGVTFNGTTWTFYKTSIEDLWQLYRIKVDELAVWRPLEEHCVEEVRSGRPVVIEVDAFHLPDLLGTTYRTEHGKTTIAALAIDPDRRWLRYLHHGGCFELEAADYDGVLRVGAAAAFPGVLDPYVETVDLRGAVVPAPSALVETASRRAREHLARRGEGDPFPPFREALAGFLRDADADDPAAFHRYAFVTMRQAGAAFEHASHFLRWLNRNRRAPGILDAAECYASMSRGMRVLQLTAARSWFAGRRPDLDDALDELGRAWATATRHLHAGGLA